MGSYLVSSSNLLSLIKKQYVNIKINETTTRKNKELDQLVKENLKSFETFCE